VEQSVTDCGQLQVQMITWLCCNTSAISGCVTDKLHLVALPAAATSLLWLLHWQYCSSCSCRMANISAMLATACQALSLVCSCSGLVVWLGEVQATCSCLPAGVWLYYSWPELPTLFVRLLHL
jgi:hypothetical protein